jgi:transposase
MARRRNAPKSPAAQVQRGGIPITTARLQRLKPTHQNAAGVDVGATQHYVAVPEGRDEVSVRCFGTFTADLIALADWLVQCGVETVAMESTGVYWIPLFETLQQRGLEVKVVNPAHLKTVRGRKTDVQDCQWIQQLHSYGLLRGSFHPDEKIGVLRSYMRHRATLVSYAGQHVQHIQKALEQMNLKLTEVVSDIMGLTGTSILDAILAGERDPHKLAALRHERCHNDEAIIALALQGNWREDHLFALQQAMDLYRYYHQKMAEVDQQIEAHLRTFEDKSGGKKLRRRVLRRRQASVNEPHMDLRSHLHQMTGMDLDIPGLGGHLLLGIISEVGLDMSRWPTEKHFASWLCLCPGNHKTGGKQSSGKTRTRKSKCRAAHLFRLGAQTLLRSKCALGAFARRMRAKLGAPKAITAVAHKLAKIFYNALRHGKDYVDQGAAAYEAQFREQSLRYLQRRAATLGMRLEPVEAEPAQA